MSEDSQIIVPPSFVELFMEPGRTRPSLPAQLIAARCEVCEDLAHLLSERARKLLWETGIAECDVLERVHRGLLDPASGVDPREAAWVTKRLAELLEWEIPTDLD
jgi:hypothetical protein